MYKFYFEQYCGPGCCTSQESTKTTEEFYSINISLLLPQIISFLEDYCYEDLFDNVNNFPYSLLGKFSLQFPFPSLHNQWLLSLMLCYSCPVMKRIFFA